MPKVTILTVVKNNYREIDLTVQSVINQTIKEKEYIIVDGNSSDGTYEIIKYYSKKYPFIKIFKINDNNLYEGINYGILNTNGEYLHLLHSGDFYYSKYSLLNIYNFSKSKLSEATFSKVLFFNKNLDITRNWTNKNIKKINFYNIPHTTIFLSRKQYKKISYSLDYKIASDTLYLYLLNKNIKKISYYNNYFVFMSDSGLSSSLKNFFTKIKEDLIVYFIIFKILFLYVYFKKIFIKIPQYFVKKNFRKLVLKKNILKLDIKNYYKHKLNKNIIIKFDYKLKMKKLIISAFNVAFVGSIFEEKISINKKQFFWPDGCSINIFQKSKYINKIPGRNFIRDINVPSYIKNIFVCGNMSKKANIWLSKKFLNKKIKHINLPYTSSYYLYNLLPKFKYNQLIILTLPTPKQEILADLIYNNNKFCKILCLGGALEMISGNDKIVPDIIYKYNLEFIWRLRTETLRRLKRLFMTSIYSLKFFIYKYKLIIK